MTKFHCREKGLRESRHGLVHTNAHGMILAVPCSHGPYISSLDVGLSEQDNNKNILIGRHSLSSIPTSWDPSVFRAENSQST